MSADAPDYLIQYVVLRTDLKDAKGKCWPQGALIAQACHATVAVCHQNYDDESVQAYLKDVDNMHKCVLGIENEEKLRALAQTLAANNVKHKLWIEQPEGYATCLAASPCKKSLVSALFKGLKLLK